MRVKLDVILLESFKIPFKIILPLFAVKFSSVMYDESTKSYIVSSLYEIKFGNF